MSEPFRIPRYMLARLAAEEYVRKFWWFLIGVPIFGIIAFLTTAGLLQAIGMIAILWPISIPARAALLSWKSGSFFEHPVRLEIAGGTLYFHGQSGKGMKLAMTSVRTVDERHGYILLWFGAFRFIALPADALPESVRLDELANG